MIPIHPELRAALAAFAPGCALSEHVVTSERGGPMTPLSIVVWFNRAFKNIGLKGCSSHSGRRTFVTRAARIGAQGRRLAARCSTAGRSPVDPDHAAVHRRRQRCSAQTRLDDLTAMVATTTIQHRQTNRQNHPKIHNRTSRAIDHAVRVIHGVCCLAGSASLIDEIRADLRG